MEKFRKSFRSSFRRKSEDTPPLPAKQWPLDRESVRANTCSFPVKYLGCVEVFEGRGLHICEEAVKIMKNSRSRPIKGSLHISSDGLRLVDASTNALVVDQTIEKVSFCAPDRNFSQGFSYICRDGASKRWMCHGFMAVKDTGERLSHALGCAFSICLERKQRRDRECAVTINFDKDQNTFTRFGSFRQGSVTERLEDPQTFKPAPAEPISIAKEASSNPHAVPRPRVSSLMYERATSLRGVGRIQLSGSSPFKRQASLRLSELPSMIERQENLIQIEDHKTDPNIRRAKISSIHSDLGPTGENATMSPSFSSLSPSSVDSNVFHLSVSQPSSVIHVSEALNSLAPNTNSPIGTKSPTILLPTLNPSFSKHEAESSLNSGTAPGPPARSPTLPPISESAQGLASVHSPAIKFVNSPGSPFSNPWDNVPDQSNLRKCDAVAVKRNKNNFPDSTLVGKSESEVKGFTAKRSSCTDPFDADWAETAVNYNSESDCTSNPFCSPESIHTF